MIPTSDEQFRASETGGLPEVENVRDDLIAVPQAMPHSYLPYSFSYLLIDSESRAHVIDPGWDADENWQRLVDKLAARGLPPEAIASITVTHFHPDHVGMAERMRAASGAPIVAHRVERSSVAARVSGDAMEARARWDDWGVPDDRRAELEPVAAERPTAPVPTVDREVDDGDRLDVPGSDLRVVWTPGHTHGHICLVDAGRGVVFTGDHVLPTVFSGLGLGGSTPTNPMADYVASLDAIERYDGYEVLPGHGYRFRGLASRVAACREHQLRRSREVAAVLADGGEPSTWEVASRLTWTAGWDALHDFFLYSALSQTAMHREFVESPEFAAYAG
ncbi:MAG: MBL fold metallo-hydrolase [Humibacter sp.]